MSDALNGWYSRTNLFYTRSVDNAPNAAGTVRALCVLPRRFRLAETARWLREGTSCCLEFNIEIEVGLSRIADPCWVHTRRDTCLMLPLSTLSL